MTPYLQASIMSTPLPLVVPPKGWNATKYPGEYTQDYPEGLAVVRALFVEGEWKYLARCWEGSGGQPTDIPATSFADAFQKAEEFLSRARAQL